VDYDIGGPDGPGPGLGGGLFGDLSDGVWDCVGASVFINLLALALPLALLQIYDRILPADGTATLTLLVGGVAVALLLEAFLQFGRALSAGWSAARFEHRVGCLAMARVLHADLADFERRGAGAHVESLNALGQLKDFYAGQALRAVLDLPFAALFLGIVYWLGGPLVLIAGAVMILFTATALVLGRRLRQVLGARMAADDHRLNFIIEVLGGIHTVKTMAMEAQMLRRYERLQETSSGWNYSVAAANATAMGVGSVFLYANLFAVAGFGSLLVMDGALSVGGLAACTMLSSRALQPLQRALGVWTRFQGVKLARARLDEVLTLQQEAAPAVAQHELRTDQDLVLDNVSFGYDPKLPPVLSNVSLRIRPGSTIAIAGGNACGKTTLLQLLMGALLPGSGQVMLGRQDLREFTTRQRSGAIAYLPQKGAIFKGTILDNITMFRPEYAAHALSLARQLGLDQVVARMPDGYHTMVGDAAGDALPRGIRQRIAVVRALSSRPDIILFDEANAAIDNEGDAKLRHLLESLQAAHTLVLVTHRPSLLQLADQVYDLADGKLTPRPGDLGEAGEQLKASFLDRVGGAIPDEPRS
jgi:ATP-binding cassette subfamily C protein LapB